MTGEEFAGVITHVDLTSAWVVVELDTAAGKRYCWPITYFLQKPKPAVGKFIKGQARPGRVYDYDVTQIYEISDGPALPVVTNAATVLPIASPTGELQILDPAGILSPAFSIRVDLDDPDMPELIESARHVGILEPVIARPTAHGIERVTGGRRQRAAKVAQVKLPALVRQMSDADAFEAQLIENLHRRELTDYEKGRALKEALTRFGDRYPTQEALAKRLGKTSAWISQHIDVVDMRQELEAGGVYPGKVADLTVRQVRELKKVKPEERATLVSVSDEVAIASSREIEEEAEKPEKQAAPAKTGRPRQPPKPTAQTFACRVCGEQLEVVHHSHRRHTLRPVRLVTK